MPAVGGHHPETPLTASTDAVFLHQPLDPLLAHPNAALDQFPPDPRPPISSAMFRIHRADVRQQRRIRQMPTTGDLPPPGTVLMKAGDAHSQDPALHTNRPDMPMAFNKGILYFWPLAVEGRGGISPPRSPRTGREPLDSSSSYRPTLGPSRQWGSRVGCLDLSRFSQSHAPIGRFLNPLYLRRAHRTNSSSTMRNA